MYLHADVPQQMYTRCMRPVIMALCKASQCIHTLALCNSQRQDSVVAGWMVGCGKARQTSDRPIVGLYV